MWGRAGGVERVARWFVARLRRWLESGYLRPLSQMQLTAGALHLCDVTVDPLAVSRALHIAGVTVNSASIASLLWRFPWSLTACGISARITVVVPLPQDKKYPHSCLWCSKCQKCCVIHLPDGRTCTATPTDNVPLVVNGDDASIDTAEACPLYGKSNRKFLNNWAFTIISRLLDKMRKLFLARFSDVRLEVVFQPSTTPFADQIICPSCRSTYACQGLPSESPPFGCSLIVQSLRFTNGKVQFHGAKLCLLGADIITELPLLCIADASAAATAKIELREDGLIAPTTGGGAICVLPGCVVRLNTETLSLAAAGYLLVQRMFSTYKSLAIHENELPAGDGLLISIPAGAVLLDPMNPGKEVLQIDVVECQIERESLSFEGIAVRVVQRCTTDEDADDSDNAEWQSCCTDPADSKTFDAAESIEMLETNLPQFPSWFRIPLAHPAPPPLLLISGQSKFRKSELQLPQFEVALHGVPSLTVLVSCADMLAQLPRRNGDTAEWNFKVELGNFRVSLGDCEWCSVKGQEPLSLTCRDFALHLQLKAGVCQARFVDFELQALTQNIVHIAEFDTQLVNRSPGPLTDLSAAVVGPRLTLDPESMTSALSRSASLVKVLLELILTPSSTPLIVLGIADFVASGAAVTCNNCNVRIAEIHTNWNCESKKCKISFLLGMATVQDQIWLPSSDARLVLEFEAAKRHFEIWQLILHLSAPDQVLKCLTAFQCIAESIKELIDNSTNEDCMEEEKQHGEQQMLLSALISACELGVRKQGSTTVLGRVNDCRITWQDGLTVNNCAEASVCCAAFDGTQPDTARIVRLGPFYAHITTNSAVINIDHLSIKVCPLTLRAVRDIRDFLADWNALQLRGRTPGSFLSSITCSLQCLGVELSPLSPAALASRCDTRWTRSVAVLQVTEFFVERADLFQDSGGSGANDGNARGGGVVRLRAKDICLMDLSVRSAFRNFAHINSSGDGSALVVEIQQNVGTVPREWSLLVEENDSRWTAAVAVAIGPVRLTVDQRFIDEAEQTVTAMLLQEDDCSSSSSDHSGGVLTQLSLSSISALVDYKPRMWPLRRKSASNISTAALRLLGGIRELPLVLPAAAVHDIPLSGLQTAAIVAAALREGAWSTALSPAVLMSSAVLHTQRSRPLRRLHAAAAGLKYGPPQPGKLHRALRGTAGDFVDLARAVVAGAHSTLLLADEQLFKDPPRRRRKKPRTLTEEGRHDEGDFVYLDFSVRDRESRGKRFCRAPVEGPWAVVTAEGPTVARKLRRKRGQPLLWRSALATVGAVRVSLTRLHRCLDDEARQAAALRKPRCNVQRFIDYVSSSSSSEGKNDTDGNNDEDDWTLVYT